MKIRSDEGCFTVDFDPTKYKTKAGAAKAFHKALAKTVKEFGMNPDVETFIKTPEESEKAGYGRGWTVSWESGPYEWAIDASWKVQNSPTWYTEPYYSFDLCFTD